MGDKIAVNEWSHLKVTPKFQALAKSLEFKKISYPNSTYSFDIKEYFISLKRSHSHHYSSLLLSWKIIIESAEGESIEDIAQMYNVSEQSINNLYRAEEQQIQLSTKKEVQSNLPHILITMRYLSAMY